MIFFFLSLLFSVSHAQTLDEIYTNWAKDNIPKSHQQIEQMVVKIWGDDASRTAPLIEMHCKALNQLLTKIQLEGPDVESLTFALNKWSQAPEDLRTQEWWEWPDTNWIRVQGEYNTLINDSN